MIFIYIVAIVGGVFLFLELINHLYKKTNAYYNSRIDAKIFMEGIETQYDLAFTGSTYSKFAFGGYEELKLNWGDFSIQAQSLEMDNAILKNYINYVKPNGVVVVVVAACLLLYRENKANTLYFSILKKENNPIYSLKGKIKQHYPLLFNPTKAMKIVIDDPKLANVYDNFPTNLSEDNCEKELSHLINLWCELFRLDNLRDTNFSNQNRAVIEQNSKYLKEILSTCKENGKRPIVVIPPFSEKLNQFFSEEFKEQVIDININKVLANEEVILFDYQKDAYFQKRPELFIDGGFRLNKYGSKIFIRKLIRDMEKKGIKLN